MNASNHNNISLQYEYKARINRVLDYIEQHIDKEFTLEELSKVAFFSKYHFHRIFFSQVHEPLFQFIQRIRIEKAAALLITDPYKSVTDTALDCGFRSSAAFARCFKRRFNMSATAWRKSRLYANSKKISENSNISKAHSNQRKDLSLNCDYSISNDEERERIQRGKIKGEVEIKTMQEMTVAYVRYIGPFEGDVHLFEKLNNILIKWASPRDLISMPETKFLTICHDAPEITDDNKLRISACITIPRDTRVSGEIGKMTIPKGKYAFVRFILSGSEYQSAWNWVFETWLPGSGYMPDDRPCFEMYTGTENKEKNKCSVDICIPVKPMGHINYNND